MDRYVVVKVISKSGKLSDELVAPFQREARLIARLVMIKRKRQIM
jgi:hypothetical protein